MDYHKQYCLLMLKARSEGRQKLSVGDPSFVYYEEHHILPEKMGGDDHLRNLVLLTGYEHYMAHYLLTKFAAVGKDRQPCLGGLAAFTMDFTGKRALTGRQIGKAREANSLATTLRLLELSAKGEHQWQTAEHSERVRQQNIANGKSGSHPSQQLENKAKHIARQKHLHANGEHSSQKQENRDALSKRMVASYAIGDHPMQSLENCEAASVRTTAYNSKQVANGKHPWQSDEYCEAQSGRMTIRNTEDAKVGRHPAQKPENRKAQGERGSKLWTESNPMHKLENKAATAERAKLQVTCPWCDKTGNRMPMQRWHFDNCLEHPENKGLTRKQIKEKLSSREATELAKRC